MGDYDHTFCDCPPAWWGAPCKLIIPDSSPSPLDYNWFPHIVERIVAFSDLKTQSLCRLVCSALCRFVDRLDATRGIRFNLPGERSPCALDNTGRIPVFTPGVNKYRQLDVMRRCPRVVIAGGPDNVPNLEELVSYLPPSTPFTYMHYRGSPAPNLTLLAPQYLEVEATAGCQCSLGVSRSVFFHMATHLSVHISMGQWRRTTPFSDCALLRGLWQPTVQVLKLCFKIPDYALVWLVPQLFPDPVTCDELRIYYRFEDFKVFNHVEKSLALHRMLARHFDLPLHRVQQVNTLRPFPNYPHITCSGRLIRRNSFWE